MAERNDVLDVVPKKEIRSESLKNGLKAYICSHVVKYYEVAAVRAILKEGEGELFSKRILVEKKLAEDSHVVGFISCLTALDQVLKGRNGAQDKKVMAGISFWVCFDWPQYGITAFENHLTKLILSCDLELHSCKAVRGRGINIHTTNRSL